MKNITICVDLIKSMNYGKHTRFDKESNFANHKSFVLSVNIPINAENDALPTLYWIPNIHKNPYREGYNAGSSTCSTKELSISMTSIVPAVRGRLKAHCDKDYSRTGINQIRILKNFKDILEIFISRWFYKYFISPSIGLFYTFPLPFPVKIKKERLVTL